LLACRPMLTPLRLDVGRQPLLSGLRRHQRGLQVLGRLLDLLPASARRMLLGGGHNQHPLRLGKPVFRQPVTKPIAAPNAKA
jgi:hypothetical protein